MNKKNTLFSILEKFKKSRILCAGDLILDKFVYGRVSRISPEAPIQILDINSENFILGGCGNVCRNISAFDGTVDLVSAIGEDNVAKKIKKLISLEKKINPFLFNVKNHITPTKTRFISGTQQLLRVDDEQALKITSALKNHILSTIRTKSKNSSVVIFSDYGKGLFKKSILNTLIRDLNKKGKIVVIDPKSSDFSIYSGATLITPNANELRTAVNFDCSTEQKIQKAALFVINKYKIKNVLITRSEKGMMLVSKKGIKKFDSRAREVFDVSGAGDTVAATFALSLSTGAAYEESALLSNIAAGIVVGKLGTAVANLKEMKREIEKIK